MKGEGTIAEVLAGNAGWHVAPWNCFGVMRELPDRSVDHAICDPPYDERTHARARSLKDGGSDIPIDFAPLGGFDHVSEMLRVTCRWVLCFCALEQLGDYKRASGDDAWVRSGVWHRPDGTPQISGDRPAQGAEGIAIMHPPVTKKRWNGGGNRGHWTCGVERNERLHPTPKPLLLMLELVELFTDPGDLVFDPFCGSATTGAACLRLGRRFIGCELDGHYASVAAERMRAEQYGSTVAAARAGQVPLFGNTGEDTIDG
jgi:site-specific DNA-methyltransferase (adenine-specific)